VDHATAQRSSRVRLFEVEPDLAQFLTSEEREEARGISVPLRTLGRQEIDVDALLSEAGAFAAVIVEGLLLHRLAIGSQPALRLLGPGDILARSGEARSALLSRSSHHANGELRLAMLDDRVLLTARRFPRLIAGLHMRMGEQYERIATQLVICQLPRVEDRVLAMMWLLAESWGRVTTSGTVLPIALTHDALGELIGARRPTVTLALRGLADRGALFRQDGGWLLLEPMPGASTPSPLSVATAEMTLSAGGPWRDDAIAPPPISELGAIEDIVATLLESHARSTLDVQTRLDASRQVRERNRELRAEIASQARRPRPAPSA
jgi:CRP/FNR family transcriptional regulator, cyclic AMP receptor protein